MIAFNQSEQVACHHAACNMITLYETVVGLDKAIIREAQNLESEVQSPTEAGLAKLSVLTQIKMLNNSLADMLTSGKSVDEVVNSLEFATWLGEIEAEGSPIRAAADQIRAELVAYRRAQQG